MNGPPGSATPFSDLPLPRPLFGGRLMVGAGPTFMFPTASERSARPGHLADGP